MPRRVQGKIDLSDTLRIPHLGVDKIGGADGSCITHRQRRIENRCFD